MINAKDQAVLDKINEIRDTIDQLNDCINDLTDPLIAKYCATGDDKLVTELMNALPVLSLPRVELREWLYMRRMERERVDGPRSMSKPKKPKVEESETDQIKSGLIEALQS